MFGDVAVFPLLLILNTILIYGFYIILFIYSSVDGQLSGFRLWAAVNNAAMIMCLHAFVCTCFISHGRVSRVGCGLCGDICQRPQSGLATAQSPGHALPDKGSHFSAPSPPLFMSVSLILDFLDLLILWLFKSILLNFPNV